MTTEEINPDQLASEIANKIARKIVADWWEAQERYSLDDLSSSIAAAILKASAR